MDRKYRVPHTVAQQPDSGLDDEHAQAVLEFGADHAIQERDFQRRRMLLAAVAGLIVITGLLVHFATVGVVGDLVADALYAVLVYLIVAFIFVRRSCGQVALVAVLLCVAIELFQLTGVPSTLAEGFPPFRYLLGTTFNALDLVAYLVGVLAAAAVTTWRQLD